MQKTIRTLVGIMSLLFAGVVYGQAAPASGGNSVYIDQTTADNSTVSITQIGSGNQIGDRTSLTTPAFLIDGNAMTATITQDGMNNSMVGNFIGGDSTLTLTQTGNTNAFTLTHGNFGTNGGSMTINKTGDNNSVSFTMASTANAGNYLYNLTITGNTNTVTSTMNSKYIENNITLTGNTNTFTTTQSGANGTANSAGHKITSTVIGSNNAITISQTGTTTPNNITLNVTGSNLTYTINQQ